MKNGSMYLGQISFWSLLLSVIFPIMTMLMTIIERVHSHLFIRSVAWIHSFPFSILRSEYGLRLTLILVDGLSLIEKKNIYWS